MDLGNSHLQKKKIVTRSEPVLTGKMDPTSWGQKYKDIYITDRPYDDYWLTAEPTHKKVHVDNDQEMAQSERNFHAKNRGVGKNLIDTWLPLH